MNGANTPVYFTKSIGGVNMTIDDKEKLMLNVGEYCRNFRINEMKLSLKDFSNITGLNNKNVNAFEYGRANNIQYLFYYYRLCDDSMKYKFSKGLFKIL